LLGAEARDAIIDKESELSDLCSSDFEDITLGAVKAGEKGKSDSIFRNNEVGVEAPISPTLQW
jgi:hypothetical protein